MGLGRVGASDCAELLHTLECAQILRPCQSYHYSSVPTRWVPTADSRLVLSSVAQFGLTSCRGSALHERLTCLRKDPLRPFRVLLSPIVCSR